MQETPSYYAIIPADVRYTNIPAQAKLLYGELTTLTNKTGYCWATNQYFAKLYGLTEISISRLLKNLEENGYIRQEYDNTQENKTRRKIYLIGEPYQKCKGEPYQKCKGSLNKNVKPSLNKNVKHNNTRMNNTSEYNKVSKKEVEQMSYNQILKIFFENDTEMQNVMTEYIKMRKLIKKPLTNYGLKLACEKLQKEFKQEERIAIVQQSIMNNWQGLYPLKKSNSQELKDKAREAYIKDVEYKTKPKETAQQRDDRNLKKMLEVGERMLKEWNNDNTGNNQIYETNQNVITDHINT